MTIAMSKSKLLPFGLAVALVAAPTVALAHEKWFIDPAAYPIRPELIFSWPVALATVVATLALLGLLLLRRFVRDSLWPNPSWLQPLQSSSQAVIGIQTAISLIFMASQGWFLAPTMPLPQGLAGLALAGLIWLISLSFVTGWFSRVGGGLLLALVVLAFLFYPTAYVLEQLLFVGVGAYFLIQGRGLFLPAPGLVTKLDRFWRHYSYLGLPALRIGMGLSILVLAFTEKLLNPALAQAFLHDYSNFNFMRLLGFGFFSDDLFIYAAGTVEATIGVLLIAGVLPRVVILLMWVPFNIAIPLLPPVELLGHLPILAVMYVIFLQGPSAPTTRSVGEPFPLERPQPATRKQRRSLPRAT